MFWDLQAIDQDKMAAIDENGGLTFKEALFYADQINDVMHEHSVVLMLSENSVGSYLGYFAFTAAEHTVIVLENGISKGFCENIINIYKPLFLWVKKEWAEYLRFDIVYEAYGYYLCRTTYAHYAAKKAGVILATSGSTGNVKCVQLGYDGIKAHGIALSDAIGFTENDSEITTMPMAFVYTLSFINFHIMKGATILLNDRSILDEKFWNFFDKYKPTCISGLTLHYEMLSLMRFFEKDSSIRIFTQGGDKLSEPIGYTLRNYCKKYRKKSYVVYGQTETSGTCGCLSLDEEKKSNCIGKAISSGKFCLHDMDDARRGELIYNGRCAMLGYVSNAEDLQKEPASAGQVETGDIVEKDKDGYFYIFGRKKRIVKLYGKRVSLDDIEEYLKELCHDCECACIGENEKIHVFIAGAGDDIEEMFIKEQLCAFLNIRKSMITISFVERLARNETGKILYSLLENIT